jgi:hypothetical protein
LSAETTSVILLGLGCAANPWGIMIAVLLLDARRGHGIVWSFVVGWVGAITVTLLVLLAGFDLTLGAGSAKSTTVVSAIELLIGLTLFGLGLRRILQGRREPATTAPHADSAAPDLPRWLHAIENIAYLPALLLGIYSATYPLVIAAAGEILRADVSTTEMIALATLFVVLGSSSVVAVAALGTFASKGSAVFLDRLRAWLTVHNRAVITVILLVLGIAITARGLTGLG